MCKEEVKICSNYEPIYSSGPLTFLVLPKQRHSFSFKLTFIIVAFSVLNVHSSLHIKLVRQATDLESRALHCSLTT